MRNLLSYVFFLVPSSKLTGLQFGVLLLIKRSSCFWECPYLELPQIPFQIISVPLGRASELSFVTDYISSRVQTLWIDILSTGWGSSLQSAQSRVPLEPWFYKAGWVRVVMAPVLSVCQLWGSPWVGPRWRKEAPDFLALLPKNLTSSIQS